MNPNEKQLEIHYVEGKGFSSNQATGVYGGLTGQGKLCMNFYIERIPLPTKSDIRITKEGKLDEKPSGLDKKVLGIREITNCVMMDIDVARNFHQWLGAKIGEFDKLIQIEKND